MRVGSLCWVPLARKEEAVLVPAALAAFFTSVAGLLSLIATGTSPLEPVTISPSIAVRNPS